VQLSKRYFNFSKLYGLRILFRVIAFYFITMALNLICWLYGIVFSAIYPRSAVNWLYCSIVTIILSNFVFQTIGFLLKGIFWHFSKKDKNM
jgi:hypothetical protein